MRETNINLEEWQYQRLKQLAAKENKALSQLLREMVQERFALEEEEIEKDPLFNVIGLGKGDGANTTRKHDDVIYRKGNNWTMAPRGKKSAARVMRGIFANISGWYPLANASDPDHGQASDWFMQNRLPLITTDYIFDELLTLTRTSLGHTEAVKFAKRLLA
jgi:hypothetical protein